MKPIIRIQAIDPTKLYLFQNSLGNEFGVEIRDFMLPSLLDSRNDCKNWIQAYKLILGHVSISLHAPVFDLNFGSMDQKIRYVTYHRYKQIFNIANDLNADFLVFHTNFKRLHNRSGKLSNDYSDFICSWKDLIHELNYDSHTILCIENSFNEPFSLFSDVIYELRRQTGYKFLPCLDYDHLCKRERTQFYRYIYQLKCKYIHFPFRLFCSKVFSELTSLNFIENITIESRREISPEQIKNLIRTASA